MKYKKPRIKRHGFNDWRVYYDGWRVFRFFSSTSCFGLIKLDNILSDKGFDMQRLVDSNHIDVDSLWCLPLGICTPTNPEVFLLLEKLWRLRKSGAIK